MSTHSDLLAIIEAGLNSVEGKGCVHNALRSRAELQGNIGIVAIGKAALSMAEGALAHFGKRVVSGLLISKEAVSAKSSLPSCIEQYVGGHPIPDQGSLDAGSALVRYLENSPSDTSLVFLISGGASALVEVLPEGVSLDQLQQLNRWLLASGLDIEKMNSTRQCVSRIKAGRLLASIRATQVTSLLMSDVIDNNSAIIGSGLLTVSAQAEGVEGVPDWLRQLCANQPPRPEVSLVAVDQEVVADRAGALNAMSTAAKSCGVQVHCHSKAMAGDAILWADYIVDYLVEAPCGLHLWFGETTVRLLQTPGCGGRNSHLALALAQRLYGKAGLTAVTIATDGDDGNSGYAGAMVHGATLSKMGVTRETAQKFLAAADSATLLKQVDALLSFAKGQSNVADFLLLLKQ